MRGDKPRPTALKVLRGNPGKRKLPPNEPQAPELSHVPEPPEWLSDLARAKWLELAPWLVSSRILTASDLHCLEAFCGAYARWREGEADVRKNGIVIPVGEHAIPTKNPAVTVINEALRQMQQHGSAIGLDPSSRARLGGAGKPDDEAQDDDAFMRARDRR